MPRKLHAAVQSWLPEIVRCHFEREPFSLLETCTQIGGLLTCLPGPQEQLMEIRSVYNYLVTQKYLTMKDGENVYYWGIFFQNAIYAPIRPKFDELVQKIMEKHPSTEQIRDQTVINLTINNRKSWINVEKLFDTLLGVDAHLF